MTTKKSNAHLHWRPKNVLLLSSLMQDGGDLGQYVGEMKKTYGQEYL